MKTFKQFITEAKKFLNESSLSINDLTNLMTSMGFTNPRIDDKGNLNVYIRNTVITFMSVKKGYIIFKNGMIAGNVTENGNLKDKFGSDEELKFNKSNFKRITGIR